MGKAIKERDKIEVDECALKVRDASSSCNLHAIERSIDVRVTRGAERNVYILL